jgi:hypothetical protein
MALGAGNVTISNSTWDGTIIEEMLTGPLVFNHDSTGRVQVPAHHTAYPVLFENGTMTIDKKSDPAGIWLFNNPVAISFVNYTFARSSIPGAQKAPLWKVGVGAQLTITGSRLSGPLGPPTGVTLSGDTGS